MSPASIRRSCQNGESLLDSRVLVVGGLKEAFETLSRGSAGFSMLCMGSSGSGRKRSWLFICSTSQSYIKLHEDIDLLPNQHNTKLQKISKNALNFQAGYEY